MQFVNKDIAHTDIWEKINKKKEKTKKIRTDWK